MSNPGQSLQVQLGQSLQVGHCPGQPGMLHLGQQIGGVHVGQEISVGQGVSEHQVIYPIDDDIGGMFHLQAQDNTLQHRAIPTPAPVISELPEFRSETVARNRLIRELRNNKGVLIRRLHHLNANKLHDTKSSATSNQPGGISPVVANGTSPVIITNGTSEADTFYKPAPDRQMSQEELQECKMKKFEAQNQTSPKQNSDVYWQASDGTLYKNNQIIQHSDGSSTMSKHYDKVFNQTKILRSPVSASSIGLTEGYMSTLAKVGTQKLFKAGKQTIKTIKNHFPDESSPVHHQKCSLSLGGINAYHPQSVEDIESVRQDNLTDSIVITQLVSRTGGASTGLRKKNNPRSHDPVNDGNVGSNPPRSPTGFGRIPEEGDAVLQPVAVVSSEPQNDALNLASLMKSEFSKGHAFVAGARKSLLNIDEIEAIVEEEEIENGILEESDPAPTKKPPSLSSLSGIREGNQAENVGKPLIKKLTIEGQHIQPIGNIGLRYPIGHGMNMDLRSDLTRALKTNTGLRPESNTERYQTLPQTLPTTALNTEPYHTLPTASIGGTTTGTTRKEEATPSDPNISKNEVNQPIIITPLISRQQEAIYNMDAISLDKFLNHLTTEELYELAMPLLVDKHGYILPLRNLHKLEVPVTKVDGTVGTLLDENTFIGTIDAVNLDGSTTSVDGASGTSIAGTVETTTGDRQGGSLGGTAGPGGSLGGTARPPGQKKKTPYLSRDNARVSMLITDKLLTGEDNTLGVGLGRGIGGALPGDQLSTFREDEPLTLNSMGVSPLKMGGIKPIRPINEFNTVDLDNSELIVNSMRSLNPMSTQAGGEGVAAGFSPGAALESSINNPARGDISRSESARSECGKSETGLSTISHLGGASVTGASIAGSAVGSSIANNIVINNKSHSRIARGKLSVKLKKAGMSSGGTGMSTTNANALVSPRHVNPNNRIISPSQLDSLSLLAHNHLPSLQESNDDVVKENSWRAKSLSDTYGHSHADYQSFAESHEARKGALLQDPDAYAKKYEGAKETLIKTIQNNYEKSGMVFEVPPGGTFEGLNGEFQPMHPPSLPPSLMSNSQIQILQDTNYLNLGGTTGSFPIPFIGPPGVSEEEKQRGRNDLMRKGFDPNSIGSRQRPNGGKLVDTTLDAMGGNTFGNTITTEDGQTLFIPFQSAPIGEVTGISTIVQEGLQKINLENTTKIVQEINKDIAVGVNRENMERYGNVAAINREGMTPQPEEMGQMPPSDVANYPGDPSGGVLVDSNANINPQDPSQYTGLIIGRRQCLTLNPNLAKGLSSALSMGQVGSQVSVVGQVDLENGLNRDGVPMNPHLPNMGNPILPTHMIPGIMGSILDKDGNKIQSGMHQDSSGFMGHPVIDGYVRTPPANATPPADVTHPMHTHHTTPPHLQT